MHADHLFIFNWHVPNRIDLKGELSNSNWQWISGVPNRIDLETRQVICQVNQFCCSAGPVRILFGKEIYPFVNEYNKIILIFV